jgi:carboxymethylenebutenolidase
LSVSIAIFTIVIFASIESLPLFAQTQTDNKATNASSKNIGNI